MLVVLWPYIQGSKFIENLPYFKEKTHEQSEKFIKPKC